ncbi:HAMP domain-containing protein [Litchfieldia salsa]|uniref:Methyl-accepting chemotaxis protein n=1 Tax=Litchfieldia salsa TaxID=930152 RepID=A0A1H0WAL7_9BACI|nr:methyl-accepting chemotaxis protein [Litchfieldia salsa]SDP87780.1 Methyl-accepting chemotaxis protein [Litchfieldia salsa]
MKARSKLADLSLRKRLILIFLAILLSLAAINCVQIYLFFGYVRQYNAMIETITLTNSINGVLKQKLNDEIRDIAYGKVPFEEGTQYDHLKSMYQNLRKIELDDKNGQFTREILEVRETLTTTTEYIDRLGEQIQGNVSADQKNITYEYITILSDLIDEKVQALLHTTLVVKEQSKNDISTSLNRDITIYIISFIAVILTALLFSIYMARSFVKPIHHLAQKTNEIADGNLTVGKISLISKNEIGDLCHSYNRMFQNLKNIILSVRDTNNLVVYTSKDIHQSILENRLAGEEVAEATQTISVNLHKQDELINTSVSTFENLFNKFNTILLKSNNINLQSNQTLQITNQINSQIDDFFSSSNGNIGRIQRINAETEKWQKMNKELGEHIKLLSLIARESSLLSLTLLNNNPDNQNNNEFKNHLSRISELNNEFKTLSQTSTEQNIEISIHVAKMKAHLKQDLLEMRKSNLTSKQIKSDFQAIRSIRDNQQLDLESIKQDIQDAYAQMLSVRQIILEIEESSKINKEEVIGIAAMGEEQFTTLEEVSEASYKLVERIQEMNENIKQFKI